MLRWLTRVVLLRVLPRRLIPAVTLLELGWWLTRARRRRARVLSSRR